MFILSWIFLGLSVVSLLLYTISLLKNIDTLQKISSIMMITFFGILNIVLLANKLPDTFNTLITTIITYAILITTIALGAFLKTKYINNIKYSLFLITTLIWVSLYNSVFYIFRVSNLLIILMITIYISLFIFTCIKIGKQKSHFYFYSLIELFSCYILNFCSIISLLYGRTLNSLVLFLGTSTNIALVLIYIFNIKKSYKHERMIKYLSLLAAQLLISYSNVILFY